MFASVNLPLHHKVQKFSSGTGSPGWSWKKGRKTVVMVWFWEGVLVLASESHCKGRNSPSVRSLVDEERMRPVLELVLYVSFSALTLLAWNIRRREEHQTCKNPVPLTSKGFLLAQVDRELVDPG